MKNFCFLLLSLLISQVIYPQENLNQSLTDTTKPTQYRRGIELSENYISYEDKYFGKNLSEEKRSKFPLQSTGVWTELNPKIPRVDYLGIHFVNKDTGWACGNLGALIKTTDGGQTWATKETNTTNPILKVRSYDGQVVLASGFGGIILRSTDGGETFTQILSTVTGDFWGLRMLNDTLGWACGTSNSLIKTTDGGQTWQQILTPGYTSDYWWIDFLSEQYGFIAANGKVLKTTDGGNNWEIIQAGDNQALFSIDAIDSLHIAAAGYGGTSYRGKNIYSSDGGYTWVNGGPLTFEAVNCIQYVNPDTGYLVMTNVSARKTTNRGQDWTTLQGITDNYELQFMKQNNIGYSAGNGLKINKAEGNLDIWNRLIINDNFSDVFFVNEQKGFVISSFGYSNNNGLYKSIDGGISWEIVTGAPDGVDLLFLDSLTGFIGASNSIYKTTDGGESWYPTNGTTGAGKIFFINQNTGWAIHSGTIYKTTDKGENWITQITLPADSYTSIFFVDSLNGWATSRYVWQTNDGGQNWIQRTDIPVFFSNDIYFNGLKGFIIEFLSLYKSDDSGDTWIEQINSQYIIRNFGWLSDTHGFIMGDGVYETNDSGDTWQEILGLRNVGLRKFQAQLNYLGYAIGYNGLIYSYFDTSYVPVELTSFSGTYNDNKVILHWKIVTELNNKGFEIEKSNDKRIWNQIGFMDGRGTSTEPYIYSFIDKNLGAGKYRYRLKQIDYNGMFEYSNTIEVEIGTPTKFSLEQNYPNPFNPITTIKFDLPEDGLVSMEIYDILGQRVTTLVNENMKAGRYEKVFDASKFASGVYIYKLQAGSFVNSRKMILLR